MVTKMWQNPSLLWKKALIGQQWAWFWTPTLAFGVSRLVVLVAIYLGGQLFPDRLETIYHLQPPDNSWRDVLASRWDSGFYISIATEGYRYQGVPLPSVAFFPLYPMLMKGVSAVTGWEAGIAGIFISHFSLWLAGILFYQIVQADWGEPVASRAVWYLMIFPTAFFGSAVYTESLFLVLTLAVWFLARKGYWESAGMMAIAVTLTRLVGVIIIPLLILEWVCQAQQGKHPPRWGLLAVMAAPLGLLGYMAYLQQQFGDSLAFLHASAAWDRVPRSPWQTVAALWQMPAQGWTNAILAGQIHLDNWLDFSFVLAFLGLALILLIKKRWLEGVYTLLGTVIPFSSGLLMSQRRYVWVLFPAFILLAQWGRVQWIDRFLTALFAMGLAIFTALFANAYWVG